MFEAEPKSILLVEDNSDDEKLTLRALRQAEIQTEVAVVRDGVEALEYLFREGRFAGRPIPVPELILLDLKLPKINGLEVLERLRSHEATRMVPVVIMSSSDEESDIVNGYRLGANSYIRKPVEYQVFMDSIRQLVMYWLQLNCPATHGFVGVRI